MKHTHKHTQSSFLAIKSLKNRIDTYTRVRLLYSCVCSYNKFNYTYFFTGDTKQHNYFNNLCNLVSPYFFIRNFTKKIIKSFSYLYEREALFFVKRKLEIKKIIKKHTNKSIIKN